MPQHSDSPAAAQAPAPPNGVRGGLRAATSALAGAVDRLYGYDVFIAHRRSDGAAYADGLATQLAAAGLSVFIDQKVYRAGDELSDSTQRHIRMSTMLVVVGTPAIRELREPQDWVLREIQTYLDSHAGADRHLVPLNFGTSLDPAPAPEPSPPIVALLASTIRHDEPAGALARPASAAVLKLIGERFQRRRRDRGRLRVFQVVAAVLLGLLALALGMAWLASRSADRAQFELRRALASRLAGQAQAGLARHDPLGDERLLQQLLAAHHLHPSAETAGAMWTALERLSALQRIVPVGVLIRCMALDPLGRFYVVGGEGGELVIIDARTGKPIGERLTSVDGSHLNAVAVSPDGAAIVAGGDDGRIHRWRWPAAHPAALQAVPAHDGPVNGLVFSVDGSRIVTGGADKRVRVWAAASMQAVGAPLAGHDGPVTSVATSADAGVVVSGSDDATVRVWTAGASGLGLSRVLTGHEAGVTAVALDAAATAIVSGGADGSLRLWDRASGNDRAQARGENARSVSAVAFSRAGDLVAASSWDGRVELRSTASLALVGAARSGHLDTSTALAFSADGTSLVSAGAFERSLRVWRLPPDDTPGRSSVATAPGRRNRVTEVAFSPDGQRYAAAGLDQKLRLWNTASGRLLRDLQHNDWLNSIAFSPDGRQLAAGAQNGVVLVWSTETGAPVGTLAVEPRAPVRRVTYAADGRWIAAATGGAGLRLWDAATLQALPVPPSTDTLPALAALGRTRRVVTGAPGGRVAIHELPGKPGPIAAATMGDATVSAVAASADGRLIASGNTDGSIRLYNANDLKPRAAVPAGHTGGINGLAFSEDGRWLVSAASGASGTLRLWDVDTGAAVGQAWSPHHGEVLAVAFSHDGRHIVTGGGDGTVALLPGPARWVDELCAKLVANMAPAQWREWVSAEIDYAEPCRGLPRR